MKKEFPVSDGLGRLAVRGVLIAVISVFLITLILNFQLVMGWMLALVILGLLGASAKVM